VAEIAACIVVVGVVMEDWDRFVMFYTQADWHTFWAALGPFLVAGGIAVEILFGRLSSKNEGKVHDWYTLEVAKLNVEAETERHARVKIEQRLADRKVTPEQVDMIARSLSPFAGKAIRVLVIQDHESLRFWEYLSPVFDRAGIAVFGPTPFLQAAIDPGLCLNVGKGAEPFADAIEAAFIAAGVVHGPIGRIGNQEGQVALRIGPK